MSNILVEIKNQGFTEVSIKKSGSDQPIAIIGKGEPNKTFSLNDGSSEVTIDAGSAEVVIVWLAGSEVESPVSVHGAGVTKDLIDNQLLTLTLTDTTLLTLQSEASSSDTPTIGSVKGVKCGEVIVVPPPA